MKYEYSTTTDDTWLGRIPKHWKIDRIKDVCERVIGGGTPKSSVNEFWDDGNIIWISPTDFSKTKGRCIENSEKKITTLGLNKSSAILLPEGAIIMSSRASIGDVKIAGKELSTNQGFVSFVPSVKLDNIYLFYVINGFLGQYFCDIASGTTFMEISRRMVKMETIPLPPLPEQKAIAAYLDKACARIDGIIEIKEKQLKRMNFALKRKIDEIILEGLGGFEKKKTRADFIGEIPKHYRIHKLKHITHQITDGAHHTPTYLDKKYDDSVPFLRVTDLHKEKINLDKAKYIGLDEHLELIKRCKPEKGDLLLSKNGTIGVTKVVDWNYDFSVFVSVAVLKPVAEHICVEYLNFYFKSEIMNYQMTQGSKQITVTNLHLDKIREFLIVTPPLEEQRKLVKKMKDAEKLLNGTISNIKYQIKTLKNYRKSLIQECVTGKKQVYFEKQDRKIRANVLGSN